MTTPPNPDDVPLKAYSRAAKRIYGLDVLPALVESPPVWVRGEQGRHVWYSGKKLWVSTAYARMEMTE